MRMYKQSKGPPDIQARDKLVVYIHEYLIHSGAPKAAQTFLNEINWTKNVSVNEPPGFLSSWWSVFWDLYCAAPERRAECEHSLEAKSFHDYGFINSQAYPVNGMAHNPNAASPLGQMPPNDGLTGGGGPGMPPSGFFHQNSHLRPSPPQQSQPPPHQQPPPPPHGQMIQNQPFMSPRYSGGPPPRPGVRMPPQHDFSNGPPVGGGSGPGTPIMPNQGDGGDYGVGGWQNPPGLGPMNHRMNQPRGQPMGPGPMNYGGIRPGPPPPNQTMGGPGLHGGMPPGVSMGGPGPGPGPGGPGGRPWQPNAMNYSSPSPANSYGPPPGGQGPQGEGMYPVMKPGGNMPGFPMGPGQGPDGPMGPLGSDLGPPMSSGGGNGLDVMKNSPANGPGTPREDGVGVPMSDYGYGQENDQNESEAILKIKESMQEEAKKFEKDTPNDHAESFCPY